MVYFGLFMVTKVIKVSLETKGALDVLKVHPRQSYDEVISGLIDVSRVDDKLRGVIPPVPMPPFIPTCNEGGSE